MPLFNFSTFKYIGKCRVCSFYLLYWHQLYHKVNLLIYNTKQNDVCLSVCLKLKILVTTEPIGFYSSGYIPVGPAVVLSYFLGGWDTPSPPKKQKISPHYFLPTYIFPIVYRDASPKQCTLLLQDLFLLNKFTKTLL